MAESVSYDNDREKHRAWMQQYVLPEIPAGASVLDAGCNDGFWTSLLADEGYRVTGFDRNEEAIAAGRAKYPGLDLHVWDIEEPWRDRFDVAFCRTLPHFFNPTLFKTGATRRAVEALTVAAARILIVAYTNVGTWSERRVVHVLENAGLTVQRVTHPARNYTLIAAKTGVPYVRARTGARDLYPQAFGLNDLERLRALLASAERVVPLREVAAGDTGPEAIGLRHDVDHNLEHAVRLAEWEHEHGVRGTYFVLPTAWYWADRDALWPLLHRITGLGHEVGLHNNAVGATWPATPVDGSALPAGFCEDSAAQLHAWLTELRGQGFDVVGTAAHGTGIPGCDNNAVWAAGYTPHDFGLQYEAYHLHGRHSTPARYLSDNRGQPLPEPSGPGQTHVLLHPEHWALPPPTRR